MAWVRIHDDAMNHPKLISLSDKAFRLWVWGLTYCQRYLTDGAIPGPSVPATLRTSVAMLVAAVLWEVQGPDFIVHDYLDWNDSKSQVEKRRREAKTRMERAREHRSQNDSREQQRETFARTSREVLRGSLSLGSSALVLEKRSGEKPDADPFDDQQITERAGRFIEKYAELYPKHRNGARYAVRPARDYAAAVTLCQTWPDDARLEKLAICFLTTDHKFAAEGSRTIPQFLALASWADGELAKWEAGQR